VQWREVEREVEEVDECPGAGLYEYCYDGKAGRRSGADGLELDPDSPDCRRCEGHRPRRPPSRDVGADPRSIEQLLAEYFDIDLEAAARERQAVYEQLAARANAASTSSST
jgi:hypothetical protein